MYLQNTEAEKKILWGRDESDLPQPRKIKPTNNPQKSNPEPTAVPLVILDVAMNNSNNNCSGEKVSLFNRMEDNYIQPLKVFQFPKLFNSSYSDNDFYKRSRSDSFDNGTVPMDQDMDILKNGVLDKFFGSFSISNPDDKELTPDELNKIR